MNKNLIIIVVAILLVCVGLCGCQSQGFRVHRITKEPINYVNMTQEQMNKFPHLKEAILINKSVETPQEEMSRLIGIIEYFNTEYICYQNEYYEIRIYSAD